MAPTGGDGEHTSLSPEDAFSILGNETRFDILRALSEADEPLSFTDLRKRVGVKRGGEFNYHLEKLLGHFVEKMEDSYALRTPGSRIVQAVLSGVVTDNPTIEPTVLDKQCYYCGAAVMMRYTSHLSVYCTQCSANFELPAFDGGESAGVDTDAIGLLRGFQLPPAGIQNRSNAELLRAGNAWANLERIACRKNICPRCSATIDAALNVCDTHDSDGGACAACSSRYAVHHVHECTNCNYYRTTQFGWLLLAHTDVLHFFTDHGINPIAPELPLSMRAILDRYDEEVISADPFKGQFTFTIHDDSITLTVDEELTVVDVTRNRFSGR